LLITRYIILVFHYVPLLYLLHNIIINFITSNELSDLKSNLKLYYCIMQSNALYEWKAEKKTLSHFTNTRWNLFQDVVARVVENYFATLNELCSSIDLCSFSEKELGFLKEYCVTLEPLSRGLDILQGEDRCYYGTLLPTLETIVKKTKAEVPNLSTMMTVLAYAVKALSRGDSVILLILKMPLLLHLHHQNLNWSW